jgi:hypothetical protein
MTDAAVDQERLLPSRPWRIGGWQSGFGARTLIVVLLSEVVVLALAHLPLSLSWDAFAFMDEGANLSVQTLLDRGLVPTVDFGYPYGLLPLLMGRLWFGVFGLTPVAYAAAMMVIDLLIAWGLARCISALKAGSAGIALVVIAMPWAALASYINLVHGVEATLICHAFAEQASGRRSRALAFLTACLFVKPTMAYLYGFLLMVLIIRDARRSGGIHSMLWALAPSAATAVILLIICGGWFGVKPLMNSLLPLTGVANYQALNYGFFRGVGRRFWLPDHVWPSFYILTPAGHYLVGTVVLLGAAAFLLRKAGGSSDSKAYGDEVVICCGIMQLAFLVAFYGDFMSWTYYYYILIIGLVGLAAHGGRFAITVLLIAVAALVGDKYQFSWVKSRWMTTRPTADMAGLWTSEDERNEWHEIRKLVGDRQVSILNTGEGLTTIMPGYAPAEVMFFSPGITLLPDLNRKLIQIASAEFVLIRNYTANQTFLDQWPKFRRAVDGCELVLSTTQYLLFRRLRPPKMPINSLAGDGQERAH